MDIDSTGRISNITPNTSRDNCEEEFSFTHHLLVPKFINSHTHIGDAGLKDQAFGMSLNEAVGANGHKYKIKRVTRSRRIAAMRGAMIEMIENGISAFYDFREGGIDGINELQEAATDLPIDLHILGRHNSNTDLKDVLLRCDGLGLSSPIFFSQEELKTIRRQTSAPNTIVATHIGEELQVIQDSLKLFGISDLIVALKYLDPSILIHLTVLGETDLMEIPSSKYIVFCPRSNAYFGLGFPPIDFFLGKNHLIGLGTDNVMTMAPNMLEELRWLVLRLKERNTSIDPIQALKLITINPSKALKLKTSCIETGYWADLLLIDLPSSRTKFGKDPILTLLFRCHLPEDISLNLYHGEVISNELC
jgi:cytosine/adenosine deaminase-related metal-dependent hydrolase